MNRKIIKEVLETETEKICNELRLERVKNDIRDIIRYSELSLQDIRNLKIDTCIIGDMQRIIEIANDVINNMKKIKDNS